MFSACRASVFQPLFFVFFIFSRGTHGNAAQRASPRPRLLPSRAAFASHCFSGQLKLESPTFRPSLCSAATPAGSAGTNHPQLHDERPVDASSSALLLTDQVFWSTVFIGIACSPHSFALWLILQQAVWRLPCISLRGESHVFTMHSICIKAGLVHGKCSWSTLHAG